MKRWKKYPFFFMVLISSLVYGGGRLLEREQEPEIQRISVSPVSKGNAVIEAEQETPKKEPETLEAKQETPEAKQENLISCFDNALCVVPALSYDRYGYRLGYGGGYYDSFLAKFSGDAIGVCYSNCIYEQRLPHGKYDRRLPSFLTERGVVVCER